MDERRRIGDHPIIIILGIISACIAIFVFFTGIDNILQLFGNIFNIPSPSVSVDYPEYQQENPVPTVDYQGLPSFGESRDISGLTVSVGVPNYDAGCDGTLEFEVTIANTTSSPIVLGFDSYNDLSLLGNGNDKLYLYGAEGALTPRCFNSYEIETIAPNSSIVFSLRTRDSLGEFKYLDLVFGENAGRIAGQIWRLDLSKQYEIPITYFGQTINKDGLEVGIGGENYFPSCDGTLEFSATIRNTTNQPIVLSITRDSMSLYGNNDDDSYIYISRDRPENCNYYLRDDIESIQPNETITLFIITKDSLSGLQYLDFVFEPGNRLSGLKWRLNLPR